MFLSLIITAYFTILGDVSRGQTDFIKNKNNKCASLNSSQPSDDLFRLFQLSACGKLMVLTDQINHASNLNTIYHTIIRYVVSHSIPFSNVELIQDPSNFSTLYWPYGMNDCSQFSHSRPVLYVLVASRAVDILNMADNCFHRHLYKHGSIFPHSSRWLVYLTSESNKDAIVLQQTASILDNVAFVSWKCSGTPQIWTFMWGQNRKKYPTEVDISTSSNHCNLFPNVCNGLNGRKLNIVLASTDDFYLAVRNDSATGTHRYVGFMISVIDTLAQAANFTYTLTPSPKEAADGFKDEEVVHALHNGHADFGGCMWHYHKGYRLNLSISYPVLFYKYTGIYRLGQKAKSKAIQIIFPFSTLATLLFIGTLAYCILLYVSIAVVIYPDEIHKAKNGGSGDTNLHGRSTSNTMATFSPRLSFLAWYTAAAKVSLSLAGQTSVPEPKVMSARIMLFLLSVSTVVFYAIYTGILTASMAVVQPENPKESYSELINDGGYKFQVLVTKNQKNKLKHSRIGLDHLPDAERLRSLATEIKTNGLSPEFLDSYLEHLEFGTVLIFYKSYLKRSLMHICNPQSYFILDEAVYDGNQMFVFPPLSELEQVLSLHIQNFQEKGIIEYLYRSHLPSYANDVAASTVPKRGLRVSQNKMDTSHFRWLLVLTGGLIVLSCAALVFEWVLVWRKKITSGRQKRPYIIGSSY